MFGYVNILKDELKVKDFYVFKAYYCGLCKSMGKNHNQACRLGLSYDMTFLAIVLSAVMPDEVSFHKKSCFLHPTSKKATVCDNPIMVYCSDMSVLLTHMKLMDDFYDNKSIKALLFSFTSFFSVRKIKNRRKREYLIIKKELKNLATYEKEKCKETDRVADCFAKITECIFSPDFISDEELLENLKNLGYNIGRWIYLIDALNDISLDKKHNNYNPYLCSENFNFDNTSMALTLTLSAVSKAYENLKLYRSQNILYNIIYLGLLQKQEKILNNISPKGCKLKNESI